MKNKNYRYFGLFGLFGFLGIIGIINNDPFQMLWMVWFVWFLFFFYKPKNSNKESLQKNESDNLHKNIIESQGDEKRKKMRILVKYFEKNEKVTNNDVERLLGVSDATATRYLEELEMGGMIKQVGGVGSGVYYVKND